MNKVQEIGMITGAVCGGLSVMTLGVVATLNNDNKQLPDVGFLWEQLLLDYIVVRY